MNKVKIPIVPLLLVKDIFVTDFTANVPEISYKTNKRISSISFSPLDLSKIIKAEPN